LGNLKARTPTAGFVGNRNEKGNAEKKITAKNFDLIVLNSLNDAGAGFGYDTNKITLIDKHNKATEFNLKSKKEVAIDIVNAIIANWHA
jgi:phosphopantothenoylcysteine decarboxylase/phosphopantothenate--cysteine ligase